MVYLSNIEFRHRGYMSGLLTRPVDRTNLVLSYFVWMDRNRPYFIFTVGSMEKGLTYTRTWWRQEEPTPNADPNMVEMTTPHPITAELYYSVCGKIDRHNMCCQEILDIKINLGTKYWLKRFNLSVFAMNVVNFWLSYQSITMTAENQADLYTYLSEDMIDNTYNRFMVWSAEGRRRNIVEPDKETFDDDNPLFGWINGAPRYGISLHVTPTKKTRKKRYGTETR